MKFTLLAIGKLRGAEAEWAGEYLKRLGPGLAIKEFSASSSLPAPAAQKAEAAWLLENLPAKAYVVLLDERGKEVNSRDLAAQCEKWEQQNLSEIVFIIGGADGVTDEIRQRADFILALGRMTWPHRLARVMLLEQIYRARQITAGHPYHRD
jgi:23S rRNA (pseudouridine1915-N3)-methyltransferase